MIKLLAYFQLLNVMKIVKFQIIITTHAKIYYIECQAISIFRLQLGGWTTSTETRGRFIVCSYLDLSDMDNM